MEGKVDDYVNVAIRIRPSQNVLDTSVGIKLINDNPPVLCAIDRQQCYSFDNVFAEEASQEDVYTQMVKPLVYKVLTGYNCTVFAYGQTGTGKTYTIGSDPEIYKEPGFILRTLDEFFDNREEQNITDISVSFCEIYNEKVFDLLSDNKNALVVKAFMVQGLTQHKVNDSYEALTLLKLGSKSRHMGETKQNNNSSRSHAIFTIYCNVKHENFETKAKLNLVDLAGSESVRKTGTEGSKFHEGININKGLFCIARVISARSTNMSHVPYRQSTITMILKDSLDKTNYITLVACISSDSQDIHETVQTLEFAQGVKKLRNKPEVNSIIQQYKKENPEMFDKLLGSAVKVRSTPLKRQNYYTVDCFNTPSLSKRPKFNNTPMPSIDETRISPPSMFSMSIPSISLRDVTPLPTLSPIVRRCTEAVQNTVMEKLEIFMKAHLHRPLPDNSHTPQYMKRLESRVTQIVRSEIIQLTGQRLKPFGSPEHDVSYIPHNDDMLSSSSVVVKRLDFGEESITSKSEQSTSEQQDVFKVPAIVPRKALKRTNLGLLNELNETKTDLEGNIDGPSTSTAFKIAPRRSTRLSLKKAPPTLPVDRRRSGRLAAKQTVAETPRPQPLPRSKKKDVPTPAPRKRDVQVNNDGSPMTNHTKYILDILNTGDQKTLQKLPSIGPKTAAQIYFYRQLNGQFNSIADLGKMESWRGTAFERFLKANLLRIDE